MLATRIRHARLAAGLTLGALGEQLGVTHTAIQKYEKGLMTPPSGQLLKLARACGVRVEYFFRPQQVQLTAPAFRRRASFGKTAQEALLLKATEQVEKRITLLNCFPTSPLPRFAVPEGLPPQLHTLAELEALATQTRHAWELGLHPIADLTDTLETLGLLVIVVDEPHPGFSGLTATARTADGGEAPVIVVSSQWPGDRQRFTLAHELGHLLLVHRLAPELDEEKACDRFAGAFLAPQAAVVQQLGATRRQLEWQELYALKHEFGLSMAGWLQRARQCDVLSEEAHLALWKRFSAKGWRQQEPGEPVAREQPRLFEQWVYRALGEHFLSEAKAAELLGIPLMRFHQARQLEAADAAAHQ